MQPLALYRIHPRIRTANPELSPAAALSRDVAANYEACTLGAVKVHGLYINSAASCTLLNSPMSWPATATVAQALRPFPQFHSGLAPLWVPLGDAWFNSLQVKATKRFSHGFDFTCSFTRAQELAIGAESGSAGPGLATAGFVCMHTSGAGAPRAGQIVVGLRF